MTTDELIVLVTGVGGSITFEPAERGIRLSAHRPGVTPRSCSTVVQPSEADWALNFAVYLEINGFVA